MRLWLWVIIFGFSACAPKQFIVPTLPLGDVPSDTADTTGGDAQVLEPPELPPPPPEDEDDPPLEEPDAPAPPAVRVDNSAARQVSPVLAFDDEGYALAAWHVEGVGIMLSTFEPLHQTWSNARAVFAIPDADSMVDLKLITNGTAFALAATHGVWPATTLSAAVVHCLAGVCDVGAFKDIDSLVSSVTLAARNDQDFGIGYLAAGKATVVTHDNDAKTSWSARKVLPFTGKIEALAFAANNSAYGALAYTTEGVTNAVYFAFGPTWATKSQIKKVTAKSIALSGETQANSFFYALAGPINVEGGKLIAPSYALTNTLHTVIAQQADFVKTHAHDDGTLVVAGSRDGVFLNSCTTSLSCTGEVAIDDQATDDGRDVLTTGSDDLVVAWRRPDDQHLMAVRRSGGVWESAASDVSADAIVPDTFALASLQNEFSLVWAKLRANGGWTVQKSFIDDAGWQPAVRIDAAAESAGELAIAYGQEDLVTISVEDRKLQSATQTLFTADHPGSVENIATKQTSGGDFCVAWYEHTPAGAAAYARFYTQGAASEIVRVTEHMGAEVFYDALDAPPHVAAADGRCIVSARDTGSGIAVFDAGTWVTIHSTALQSAVTVTETIAFFVGDGNGDIRTRRYVFGTGWESPVVATTAVGDVHDIRIAKDGETIAFVWLMKDEDFVCAIATNDIGFDRVACVEAAGSVGVDIASHATGFSVAYTSDSGWTLATLLSGTFEAIAAGAGDVTGPVKVLIDSDTLIYATALGIDIASAESPANALCAGDTFDVRGTGTTQRTLCAEADGTVFADGIESTALPGTAALGFWGNGSLVYRIASGNLLVRSYTSTWSAETTLASAVTDAEDASIGNARSVAYVAASGLYLLASFPAP